MSSKKCPPSNMILLWRWLRAACWIGFLCLLSLPSDYQSVTVVDAFTIPAVTKTTTQQRRPAAFVSPPSQVPQPQSRQLIVPTAAGQTRNTKSQQQQQTHWIVLSAGGFEWEDPGEALDQGVDNPFKNPELLKKGEEGSDSNESNDNTDDNLKIDPARLLGPRLNGSNLYFIGMMGSGKSAVGKIVSKRMGSYTFLDTDEIIEKATSMTIPEIFEKEGVEEFRNVEGQVLDSVHPYVRCVISTGGGIVERMENWAKLHTGLIVWLDATPDILYDRIKGDTNRPLLQTDDPLQTLKDLLEKRKSKYQNADLRIEIQDDGLTVHDVADQVIRELHDFIDDNPPAWKLAKQKAQAEGLDWVQ